MGIDKKTALLELVSEIFGKDVHDIGRDFLLRSRRLEGSVGSGILDAAIRRRLGVVCPGVYGARTYGDLEDAVLGDNKPKPIVESTDGTPVREAEQVGERGAMWPGLACGVDIEMVENLPIAEDYWDADFYRNAFSSGEIAYCVQQEEPRMHFAARWCAKEALKKCHPEYMQLEMSQLEVVMNDAGRPSMRLRLENETRELEVAVSMSHTPVMATAIVVESGRSNT